MAEWAAHLPNNRPHAPVATFCAHLKIAVRLGRFFVFEGLSESIRAPQLRINPVARNKMGVGSLREYRLAFR